MPGPAEQEFSGCATDYEIQRCQKCKRHVPLKFRRHGGTSCILHTPADIRNPDHRQGCTLPRDSSDQFKKQYSSRPISLISCPQGKLKMISWSDTEPPPHPRLPPVK